MSSPLPLVYGEVAELRRPRRSLVGRVAYAALQLAAVVTGMSGLLATAVIIAGALNHG